MSEMLPRGREVDVQAALAMGYTWRLRESLDGPLRFLARPDQADGYVVAEGDEPLAHDWDFYLPHFSTDPTAMMECWKWLEEQGYLVRVQTHPDNEPFLLNDNDEPEMPVHQKAACILHYMRGQHAKADSAEHQRWFHEHIPVVFGSSPMHVLALAVVEVGRRLKEATT